MTKKCLLSFCFLFSFCASIFCVSYSEKSWRILEQAQVCFDSGNYGDALKFAREASVSRKNETENEFNVLDKAISPAQVRKAGDEFSAVLKVLKEREQKEAADIIEKYLKLYGNSYYKDSIHNMLDWLKERNVYPEADYLTGKIYQVEGEYAQSLSFFERAYSEKDYLDISDMQYEILYSIGFIAKINDDLEKFEKTLLLILNNDEFFKNELLKKSITKAISDDKNENVDRIFLLYRADSKYSLMALSELGDLYETRKESKKALECSSLAAVESFAHILTAIEQRNSQFKYTSLENFFEECKKYEEILIWSQKNNVWSIFYQLAKRAGANGNIIFAQTLYSVMANSIPDSYYRSLSAGQLSD
ncbi:hypothetical protein [uncultured Treponema sp.]|uniref:hypothetical protein n=1 Tax=uncultured Treponema sp. TaxID=162155 RepID=UPI0025EAB7B9|nr:hypothetical protein [uncultured Treponema sp.]